MGVLLTVPVVAWSHGFAGKRMFPTTFEVDDPFVMDEFSVLASHTKESRGAGTPAMLGTGISADYTFTLKRHWGITLGGEFRRVEPKGGSAMHGFTNLVVGTKYQFFTSDRHEAIASIGLDASVGTTGDQRVGADPFSVIYPTVFFGKGMGDLPPSLDLLRPLAVTATFGAAVPTEKGSFSLLSQPGGNYTVQDNRNPTSLLWGITVQYSLLYLQSVARDVGLRRPFDQMIGVVEFAMESRLDGSCKGQTSGMVNPGLIWVGEYIQLGVAAQIPVNDRTGSNVGVMGLFHLFVDDLLDGDYHDHEHALRAPDEHDHQHE